MRDEGIVKQELASLTIATETFQSRSSTIGDCLTPEHAMEFQMLLHGDLSLSVPFLPGSIGSYSTLGQSGHGLNGGMTQTSIQHLLFGRSRHGIFRINGL